MQGGKALLLILVVGLLVAGGLFYFIPGLRPAFVQEWFHKAKGFTKATSAEDALDKFKQAIEKRDYKAASLYLGGDYKEFFDKGIQDAQELGSAIDDLRHAMKTNGVKTDKGDAVLFLLDPFPAGFKYKPASKGDKTTAELDWTEELHRYKEGAAVLAGADRWHVNNLILNSLMPFSLSVASGMTVTVQKDKDGAYRIYIPVTTGTGSVTERHMRDNIEYLRKNGSNFKNALTGLKNDVKNNPVTKENFEKDLRVKLEESK
jgi:hypothetical protein